MNILFQALYDVRIEVQWVFPKYFLHRIFNKYDND